MEKIILGSAYLGAKASGYDDKRKTARKWSKEHDFIDLAVSDMPRGTTILDVPVGTGRLLKSFQKRGFVVTGADVSEDMMAVARKLKTNATLETGDATKLKYRNKSFDAVVCLRLLHLVNEKLMYTILDEIVRVSKKHVILSIQLGKTFKEGHDTATHDETKFKNALDKKKLRVVSERRLTGAGWTMMHLHRR